MIGLGGAAFAILCLGALEAVTVGRAVIQIRNGSAALRQIRSTLGDSPDGWTPEHIATARILQGNAHNQIAFGYQRLNDDKVLQFMGLVPGLRNQSNALLDLAGLASAASAATGDYIEVAQAVVDDRGTDAVPGERLLALLKQSEPYWRDADSQLSAAQARVAADSAHGPGGPLKSALDDAMNAVVPLADAARIGVVASKFGPPALGSGAPQTYLVLLPNPSEIRPAGGFSGAIATTVFSRGAPSSIEVKNQEDFNPQQKKKFDVPTPLARYLKFSKNQLELGDAGWDPDFPTTAHLSEQMYAGATGRLVDGTISIDPYALSALLAVVGPVDVPGYGTFDSANFFPKLNVIVNASSAPGAGKGALSPISKAVLSKVLNAPASSWPAMFAVFKTQAEQRHLQAYFHEPTLAQAAASLHYDGGIAVSPADYLMLVDANVGATKGDSYVHKSMQVRTEVQSDRGVALHQVDVMYEMPLPVSADDRALNPGDGSYRDYVGFILPQQAAVASLEVLDDHGALMGGIDAVSFSHDRQVVNAFVRVPRGQTSTVKLVYEVPIDATRNYNMYLQKQAGLPQLPTDLLFSYPGGQARRTFAFAADQQVGVTW
jgi:hypothetical protein